MAFLSENAWKRHRNPWSGWTRVLSMPAIGTGLYFHSWWILGAAVVWLIVNPILFSEPKSIDNWMSMGVIGEEMYFADGKKLRKDLPTLLNMLNIPMFFAFGYFCWVQNSEAAVLSGLLVMVIKFWFIDRMVALARSKRVK